MRDRVFSRKLSHLRNIVEAVLRLDQAAQQEWMRIPDGTVMTCSIDAHDGTVSRSLMKSDRSFLPVEKPSGARGHVEFRFSAPRDFTNLCNGKSEMETALATGRISILGPAPLAMPMIRILRAGLAYGMRCGTSAEANPIRLRTRIRFMFLMISPKGTRA